MQPYANAIWTHLLPPFSHDVAASDFFFFPEMKKELSGPHFNSDDDDDDDDVILWTTTDFCKEGILVFHDYWTECVNIWEEYVFWNVLSFLKWTPSSDKTLSGAAQLSHTWNKII